MSLVTKAQWFLRYMGFFAGIDDARRFSALRRNQVPAGAAVDFGVRGMPGVRLTCRPGTSDAEVLWDVFWGKYHLPAGELPQDAVIFDLGANVGFSCFDYGRLFPQAQIIGVELDGDNVGLARRNTATLGDRCRIIHAGVWSEDGEVAYSKSDEAWGYQISQGGAGGSTRVTVRAVAIDTLMREAGVDWIDFMKMDIEGAEHDVLRADTPWLQQVGEINLEVHAPATIEGCLALLSDAGFGCERSRLHKNGIVALRPAAAARRAVWGPPKG